MKKQIFLLITLFIYITQISNAQAILGFKIGPSFSKMRIDGESGLINQGENFTGFRTGVNYQYQLNPAFAVESGLYYNKTGFTVQYSEEVKLYGIDIPLNVRAITQMHFLEMPLLMNVNFGNEHAKFFIHAGPQLSYAADADLKLRARLLLDIHLGTYDINMRNNNFRQFELSGVVGGGLIAKLDKKFDFKLGIDYMHGFTDLTDEPLLNVLTKRSSVNTSVGLSYKF